MIHQSKRSSQPDDTVVKVVDSRQLNDCSICALCTITGLAYEDVLIEVARLDKQAGRRGLWFSQLKRIAARYGISMRVKRHPDLDDDTGILNCVMGDKALDHAVVLKRGQIIEWDRTIWDASVFLEHHHAQPGVLLMLAR